MKDRSFIIGKNAEIVGRYCRFNLTREFLPNQIKSLGLSKDEFFLAIDKNLYLFEFDDGKTLYAVDLNSDGFRDMLVITKKIDFIIRFFKKGEYTYGSLLTGNKRRNMSCKSPGISNKAINRVRCLRNKKKDLIDSLTNKTKYPNNP